MAKRILLILTVLALIASASGCTSIFASDYYYVSEYSEGTESSGGLAGTEIKNYAQLRSAISEMVNRALPGGELSFSGYTGPVRDDMAAVCYEIETQTPMGAYAVEDLSYEFSRIVSYYTAQISISYKRSLEEIESVVLLNGVSSLRSYLTDAVVGHSEKLVLRIFSSTVNEDYIKAIVSGAYLEDPLVSAREPVVSVTGYPGEGVNRIYEIGLDYGMDTRALAELRERLERRIDELCRDVTAQESWRRALELAQALCALFRAAESGDGSADTVSGALLDGRASSMGAALAYKALCDGLGIECIVVRGRLGTLGTQDHYWNIIGIDGDYYHVDVSRLETAGPELAFLLDDASAWGTYMWDSGDYPVCSGGLDYAELTAPPEDDGPEVPVTSADPSPEPSVDPTEPVSPEPSEGVEPTEPIESEGPAPTGSEEPPDVSTVEPTEPVKSHAGN